MNVIVCVDDRMGMLFNKRRQSQDIKVLEDIASFAEQVSINSFSEKLFESFENCVCVDEGFLQKAGVGDYCFVENKNLEPLVTHIEQLVVYKWNRKYPADKYLDLPLDTWTLLEQKEFSGNSHEKITREIYKRG